MGNIGTDIWKIGINTSKLWKQITRLCKTSCLWNFSAQLLLYVQPTHSQRRWENKVRYYSQRFHFLPREDRWIDYQNKFKSSISFKDINALTVWSRAFKEVSFAPSPKKVRWSCYLEQNWIGKRKLFRCHKWCS